MAKGKSLGVFWGEDKVYLVEPAGSIPARVVAIPLPSGEESGGENGDINITALIQKSIRDEHINADQVKFAVPPGESIIRSFLVPAMASREVASAVEFEAKKYLPFSLKDLAYAFHPVAVTDNKVKKLRIILAAVRKSLLQRYTDILEQAKLDVVFSEPAPLSFVRALAAKRLMPADPRAAVLQVEESLARIIFVHEGIVPFIREFQIGTANTDPELAKARFVNEVQNSLEFYARHYFQQPVTQMVVLSRSVENPYAQWLQESLTGITVKAIDAAAITGTQPPADQMGIISAFGASLANEGRFKAVFNLSKKKVQRSEPSLFGFLSTIDFKEYVGAMKVAAVCAVVLICVFVLTQAGLSNLKGSIESLKNKQGGFAEMSVTDIQAKVDRDKARLEEYKKIPFKSSATKVLAYITASLPEAVWLNNFSLKSAAKGRWSVDLSGYAYTPDPSQEMGAVNETVSRIKNEKHLAQYFDNVNFFNLQRLDMDGHTVVSFNLSCT